MAIRMAVASGPAGPVLAGPVFDGIAHAQNSNNVRKSKNNDQTCTSKCLLATSCVALKLAAMLSYFFFSFFFTNESRREIYNKTT